VRPIRAAVAAGSLALVTATTAAAHGIGGRGDLPISKELYVWGAGLAVAASFAVVGLLWKREVLPAWIGGHAVPAWTKVPLRVGHVALRVVGLIVFAVAVVAAWAGSEDPTENLDPVLVYVVFWVGLAWLGAVAGDVWRALNPWDTLAMLASRRLAPTPRPHPPDRSIVWSHWPAAAGILSFTWLELAYVEPSSLTALAVAITGYSIVVLLLAARYGRRWLQTGEGFTVLFGLYARIAPIHRDAEGRIRVRVPFAGLAGLDHRRGTVAVVLVVLGGTTFDGLSRTSWWGSQVRLTAGWERTAVNTLGLVATIAAVAAVYVGATLLVARLDGSNPRSAPSRYVHSLVPIALAYSVAHYFSLLVFQGQEAWRLMSDPLGRGWDLFGTADHVIDYLALTTGAIALVQTVAMVVGHAAGVTLAHDRALRDSSGRRAALAQLPLLIAMVAFTVSGLTLLLSA
jgi:hypothetical protein